jgi:hypothetical protein
MNGSLHEFDVFKLKNFAKITFARPIFESNLNRYSTIKDACAVQIIDVHYFTYIRLEKENFGDVSCSFT